MGTDAPDQSSFKYTKTHSHVTFISDDKHKQTGVLEGGHDSGELFETEGTPLMHANFLWIGLDSGMIIVVAVVVVVVVAVVLYWESDLFTISTKLF